MSYLLGHWSVVAQRFSQHLRLTLLALAIALIIAVPIGILVTRFKRLEGPVLGLFGVLYTIPSLALLVLLIPLVHLGITNALIVLVTYAQVILVRNIVVGLNGVSPALLEAARGMGMNNWQRLIKIELPLALPVIIAGVRIAVVAIIGIGTVAALVNAGGLGALLFEGVARNYPQEILVGGVGVALLAGLANLLLRIAEQRVTRNIYGDT
ncbi:MAG: ABC transporter permease [Herpetosiphonaceae bacterium]|nr:ABC transporter permease [Herpetosiphonaceae bacterium]